MRARRQLDQVAGALHAQAANVGERLALRVFGEAQQRGGSGLGSVQLLRIEAGEVRHSQLLAQLALAECCVELPGRAVRDRRPRGLQRGRYVVAVDQNLRCCEPGEPPTEFGFAAFGKADLAAGQCQPGEPVGLAAPREREQSRVALVGE